MNAKIEFPNEFLASLQKVIREEIALISGATEKSFSEAPKMMKISEVAEYMQVSIPTVKSYMRQGLPYFQDGQIIRFHQNDVFLWTNTKKEQTT